MNKEFITKRFIKAMNERTRAYDYNVTVNEVIITKINLDCIIIKDKRTNINHRLNIRTGKVENCVTNIFGHRNYKNREEYFSFEVIAMKKENFFIIKKNEDIHIINDKPSEFLLRQFWGTKKYTPSKNLISFVEYRSSIETVIDLNENSFLKKSSRQDFILRKNIAYDLKENKILELDIDNKKLIYKNKEIKLSNFKINKNEYFIYDLIINKHDNDEYIYLKMRTKKNTEREIMFKINEHSLEIKSEFIQFISNIFTYNDKMYIVDINSGELIINLFEGKINESLDINKNIKFDLTKKKDLELLLTTYYYKGNQSNFRIDTSINSYFDEKDIFIGYHDNKLYLLSRKFNIFMYFDITLEQKIFYFDGKKIFKQLGDEIFLKSLNRSDMNEDKNLLDTRLKTIERIEYNNKTLNIKVSENFYSLDKWGSVSTKSVKEINYYFDINSNYIINAVINRDRKSIFNDDRMIKKRLKKTNKSLFKINNIKNILATNTAFNEWYRNR